MARLGVRRLGARRPASVASIEGEVARLGDLDLVALRLRWQALTGRKLPADVPKPIVLALVAYRIQADAFGDLDAASVQFLKAAGAVAGDADMVALTDKIDQRNQELAPGAILTRRWGGQTHRVMVLAEGFGWEGKTYDSLSRIAFAITGTKWNGPRFFGLRSAVARGSEVASSDGGVS